MKHGLTVTIPYYLHHWVGQATTPPGWKLIHAINLLFQSNSAFKQPQLWKASKIQDSNLKILLQHLCHIYYWRQACWMII